MSMSAAQLREIEARARAATPRPKEFWYEKREVGPDDPGPYRQCSVWSDWYVDYVIPPIPEDEFRPADAELLAHAREDILALLDEVARLRRLLVETGKEPHLALMGPGDDFRDLV
jgi:hypothetical protein